MGLVSRVKSTSILQEETLKRTAELQARRREGQQPNAEKSQQLSKSRLKAGGASRGRRCSPPLCEAAARPRLCEEAGGGKVRESPGKGSSPSPRRSDTIRFRPLLDCKQTPTFLDQLPLRSDSGERSHFGPLCRV